MKTDLERFNERLQKLDSCWELTGHRNYCNRSYMSVNKKLMQAHRAAYILFNGEIPDGMCVLHTCDNPACVNPDHLYLGTKKQNAKDREKRGRHGSGWTILKPKQVKAIRTAYDQGVSALELAEKYNRDPLSIFRIVSGKSYQSNGERKPVGG